MRLLALGLWLLLLLPATSLGDASLLAGIWWSQEDGVQITFRADGTLSIAAKEAVQEGRWSGEGETLLLTLKPPGAAEAVSLTCLFRIAEDRLVIRPGDPRCGESSFQRLN